MSDTNNDDLMFPLSEPEDVFKCPIFKVQERTATSKQGDLKRNIYTLAISDWVNIIPVTASGHVVLIEQHRFGSDSIVLETPGGAVDPHEKDHTQSAVRELEEETGLTSQRILALPSFLPNPAIHGNRISYFIAFDVQPVSRPIEHNDPFEKIRLKFVEWNEALWLARHGRLSHALSALAILLAEPMLSQRFAQKTPDQVVKPD